MEQKDDDLDYQVMPDWGRKGVIRIIEINQ